MKKHLVFWLLALACSCHLQAQELDWFALNDGSSYMSPHFMEVDPEGNSYIVGQFQEKPFFARQISTQTAITPIPAIPGNAPFC